MATTKLAKHLPKRCTNEKRKASRQASYNRSIQKKSAAIILQDQQETENKLRGFTGKMLDDAFRKAFRADYRTYKRAWQNGDTLGKAAIIGIVDGSIGVAWRKGI